MFYTQVIFRMRKKSEPVETDKFPLKRGVSKYYQHLLTEISITTTVIR